MTSQAIFLHFSVANRVQKLLHIVGIDTGSDDAVNIHAKSDTQQQHLQAVSSLPNDIDTEQGYKRKGSGARERKRQNAAGLRPRRSTHVALHKTQQGDT